MEWKEKFADADKLRFFAPFIPKTARLFIPFGEKLLSFLGSFFGIKILLAFPEKLGNFNPETFELLAWAQSLREKNVIESITKIAGEVKNEVEVPFRYKINLVSGADILGEAHGYHLFSDRMALEATIYNALKLFSILKFSPRDFIDASFKTCGSEALNIFNLAGISENIRKKNHAVYFPLKFDADTIFRCVKGYSLRRKKEFWVPLQLISKNYSRRMNQEPLLRFAGTSGVSAAPILEEALVKAALDLIERDACMITWLNALSPPLIQKDSIADPDLKIVLGEIEKCGLAIELAVLPTDLPVYVVSAIITDRRGQGPAVTISSGADFDLKAALLKALIRALAFRQSSIRNKFDTLSKHRRVGDLNDLKLILPKIGRKGRLIFWSRPGMEKKIAFLLRGEQRPFQSFKDYLPTDTDFKKKYEFIATALERAKLELIYVNISPPQFDKRDGVVIATVIPELQPMHGDEILPYVSGERLRTVPDKLGYKIPLKQNPLPHPFQSW